LIRSKHFLSQSSTWVGLALMAAVACSVETKSDFEFNDEPEAGAGGSSATAGKGGAGGKGGSSGGKAGSSSGGKGGSSGGRGGTGGKGGTAGANEGGEAGMVEGGMGGSSGTAGSGGTAGGGGSAGTTPVDPCDPNPCQNGTCEPDGAAYTCDCIDGYTGDDCETNIDDCAGNPCEHDGVCLDRVASYECDCSGTGYTGDTCETLIENCAQSPCENGGVCTDVGASRTCDCTGTGAQGESCEVDIDECGPRPCAHGICTNGRNMYTCDCNSTGYQGTNCDQDINECSSNNGGCDPLTQCINLDGSHTCGDCPSGYNGNGTTGCSDINECSSNNGGCDPLTSCTNTPGSRTCSACPSGYSGTGATGCMDINECSSNNGGCDVLTTCTNTPGGRNCGACPAGYTGTGATGCMDINECSSSPCRNGGSCTNTPGSYTCTCPSPWTGSICGNATIVVNAVDRGWWRSDGAHTSTNVYTTTGWCGTCVVALPTRSFFLWNIPSFVGTVSSVTMSQTLEAYDSPSASEVAVVYDVSTAPATLTTTSTNNTAVFSDLGSGTSFGSFTVTAANVGTVRSMAFSAAGATAVYNARGGQFAVGITEQSFTQTIDVDEFIRFSTDTALTHQLSIVVVP